jgi:hypothetical protein
MNKTGKKRVLSPPHPVLRQRGLEKVGEEVWGLEFVDGDRTKQIADGEGAHHRSTIGDDA